MKICDDLWMARFILEKISEQHGYYVNYHPKPVMGNWNGSGGHVNVSTKETRSEGGLDFIKDIMKRLEKNHIEDIKYYGSDNDMRMTGRHETSDIKVFTSGIGHRGCSVRINKQVAYDKKGYFEDRRPASNLDPYKVFMRLMKSIFETK